MRFTTDGSENKIFNVVQQRKTHGVTSMGLEPMTPTLKVWCSTN